MTDRVKGFVVVLKDDLRIDDARPIKNAILMTLGVLSVEDIVDDPLHTITTTRAKMSLLEAVIAWMDSWHG